jgi:hypothetical protein
MAVLNGKLALALGKTCFDDWAKVMVVATVKKVRTRT